MYTTYVWHKFNLHSAKVIALLALLMAGLTSHAQVQQKNRWVRKNNPNYDERALSYGFLIGLHTSSYRLRYSDQFVTPQMDTVFAVQPEWSPGFALGFIVNYKLADFFDLRLTPTVAFHEDKVRYLFTDDTPSDLQRVESTMVEFPILLKYKSERRGNVRMYMIGGVKPAIEASGRRRDVLTTLETRSTNLSLDLGFGFDLYYPLFKFSPEIRFSRGMLNMLDDTTNKYGQPLRSLNTNTITVYLLFQ